MFSLAGRGVVEVLVRTGYRQEYDVGLSFLQSVAFFMAGARGRLEFANGGNTEE